MIRQLFFRFAADPITAERLENVPQVELTADTITSGLQLVFGILGAVTFLMIVVSGFRYTVSQGDPQATAKAKNSILYALVGLIIAMSAFGLVTFVLRRI